MGVLKILPHGWAEEVKVSCVLISAGSTLACELLCEDLLFERVEGVRYSFEIVQVADRGSNCCVGADQD